MRKRTKIVATLGPASSSKEILKRMIQSGMDIARINFSHGTHESNGKIIDILHELSDKLKIPVGVMADLQGPRIRIKAEEELKVERGESIIVSDIQSNSGKIVGRKIVLDWPGIIKSVNVGHDILIEDGLIKLKVSKKEKNHLIAEVIDGGIVKNHKGVNIPDANLKVGAVTRKDEEDLKYALTKDVDFVALSFVSNKKEINETREKIMKMLKRKTNIPQIVSKIERKEALKNIDEIISATDIIMVARGDLGIEIEESKVIIYQKELVSKCLRTATPVIVATQMLNSMIDNPRPTRAEVSDVSNAVCDHADAVMLSGESASGKYPVESVAMMTEIIQQTEISPFDDLRHGFLGDSKASISAAVAHSAHELAKDSNAKAIIVASITGLTARMVARHRPLQDIYVMTNNERTHRQLTILWGAESFVLPDCRNLDELISESKKMLLKNKILRKGDKVVIVTGRPHVKKEHMSLIKVEEIK